MRAYQGISRPMNPDQDVAIKELRDAALKIAVERNELAGRLAAARAVVGLALEHLESGRATKVRDELRALLLRLEE
jgi:hypothetical protein